MSSPTAPVQTDQIRFKPPGQFQNVPIITLSYQLYALFHTLVIEFPKSQRYSLGSLCQKEILSFIKLMLRASTVHNEVSKSALLREASVTLDSLKLFFSLCRDCRCFSNQTYQQLESQVNAIGKMLGGWLKSISSSP